MAEESLNAVQCCWTGPRLVNGVQRRSIEFIIILFGTRDISAVLGHGNRCQFSLRYSELDGHDVTYFCGASVRRASIRLYQNTLRRIQLWIIHQLDDIYRDMADCEPEPLHYVDTDETPVYPPALAVQSTIW
jgi:hypothetical protein